MADVSPEGIPHESHGVDDLVIELSVGVGVAFSSVSSRLRAEPFNWTLVPALDP